MSTLEMWMLAALGEHAAEVTVTLLADPEPAEFRTMRANEVSLFSRTNRLHRRLTEMFGRNRCGWGRW